jgi:thioredoxin reductase
VIHRRDKFRAEPILIDRLEKKRKASSTSSGITCSTR